MLLSAGVADKRNGGVCMCSSLLVEPDRVNRGNLLSVNNMRKDKKRLTHLYSVYFGFLIVKNVYHRESVACIPHFILI